MFSFMSYLWTICINSILFAICHWLLLDLIWDWSLEHEIACSCRLDGWSKISEWFLSSLHNLYTCTFQTFSTSEGNFLELKVSLYMSSWRHEIKDVLNIDNRKSMYFILTICLQFLFSFLIFTQLQDTGIWCIPCIGETEIVEGEKLICPWKHLRTCSYFKAKFKQMRNGSDETLRTLH